jgi:hypothetical protein
VGREDWVILWNGDTNTAAAYLALAQPPDNAQQPQSVTLRIDRSDSRSPFVDRETGSRWDIAGRATSGERKGWTLGWLDGTQVKWFAWAAEYPSTSVYLANRSMP